MFLSVYEYFSGPIAPNPLLLAVLSLYPTFSNPQDRPALPVATSAARVHQSQATSTFVRVSQAPVRIARPDTSHPCSTMQNTTRQPPPVSPRHSDTPAFDRDDPYPGCPSGRPLSIFRLATPPPDPESPPPVAFSSPIRPAAVCKCSSFRPRSPGRSDSHSAETSVRLRSPLKLVAEAKSGDLSMQSTNAKFPF